MATVLQIAQDFGKQKGLPSILTVFGSTDTQVIQIGALIQAGLEDLRQRGMWQELTREASWTTLALEDQGSINTIAPDGFHFFVPDTFWDRTDKIPLTGPVNAQQWQYLKALIVTGPRYTFRIRADHMLVAPAPPAGHTWAFEYQTKYIALNGVTYKEAITDDGDNILLPEAVVKADLHWRWKKEKGLDYAEDFNSFERLANNALGRSGGKRRKYMHESGAAPKPGIFIPIGSWDL